MPKIEVDRESFLSAVNIAAKAAANKTTVPILTNLRISRESVIGTDTERAVIANIPATGDANFLACVDAKKLQQFVKPLPADAVLSISVTDRHHVTVKTGGSTIRFGGVDPAPFPELPSPVFNISTIPGDKLSVAIELIKSAICQTEHRFGLKCAYLDQARKRIVATDGNRLHMADLECGEGDGHMLPLSMVELLKFTDAVELGHDENHYYARSGGVTVMARKIQGKFPDYARIVPTDLRATYATSGEAIVAGLQRVMVAGDQVSRKTTLEFRDSNLIIQSASGDLSASEEIAVTGATPSAIDADAKALIDAARCCGDALSIHLADRGLLMQREGFTALVCSMGATR